MSDESELTIDAVDRDTIKYCLISSFPINKVIKYYSRADGSPIFQGRSSTSINNREKTALSRSYNAFRKDPDSKSVYQPLPLGWDFQQFYTAKDPGQDPAPKFTERLYQSQFRILPTMGKSKKTKSVTVRSAASAGATRRDKNPPANPPANPRGILHATRRYSPPDQQNQAQDETQDAEVQAQYQDEDEDTVEYNKNVTGLGLCDIIWRPFLDSHGNAYSGPVHQNMLMNLIPFGAESPNASHDLIQLIFPQISLEAISHCMKMKGFISPCCRWIKVQLSSNPEMLIKLIAKVLQHLNMMQYRLGTKGKFARKLSYRATASTLMNEQEATFSIGIRLPGEYKAIPLILQEAGVQPHELSAEAVFVDGHTQYVNVVNQSLSQSIQAITFSIAVGTHPRSYAQKIDTSERDQERARVRNARRMLGTGAQSEEESDEDDMDGEHVFFEDTDDEDEDEDDDDTFLTEGVSKLSSK